jgi:hypothetical protein
MQSAFWGRAYRYFELLSDLLDLTRMPLPEILPSLNDITCDELQSFRKNLPLPDDRVDDTVSPLSVVET